MRICPAMHRATAGFEKSRAAEALSPEKTSGLDNVGSCSEAGRKKGGRYVGRKRKSAKKKIKKTHTGSRVRSN